MPRGRRKKPNLLIRIGRKLVLACIGFVVGIICSILLYEFIISELNIIDEANKNLLYIITAIKLSIGFAFSRTCRTVGVLTLPEFTSQAGRRTMQATVLILMISGPVHNIIENGEETVRFLACIKDMLLDVIIAGKDLVLAPIQHILFDLKNSGLDKDAEQKYNVGELQNIMNPIVEEVEGQREVEQIRQESDRLDDQWGITHRSDVLESKFVPELSDSEDTRIEKQYRKKLAYKCEQVFSTGVMKCVEVFKAKYDECKDAVSVVLAWALCWPFKLEFVCDVLNVFMQDSVCDMADIIETGFGETYNAAKSGIVDFSHSFKVNVNYEGLSEIVNLDSIKSTRDLLLEQYLNGKEYVEYYLTLVKRFLSFSYILVVVGAYSYHCSYFSSLANDNIYISRYFRHIDARRRAEGKETLLPLKSFERPNFAKILRLRLTDKELKKFMDLLFALFVQGCIIATIFGFDYLFAQLLLLVRKHAKVNIKQTGNHVLGIHVKGSGILANILRIVIKDFSISKQIDMKHFTKPCLPSPRITPKSYYERVITLFLLLILNAYFHAHLTRLRHRIVNYFYPKRARKRTIWLYNETLRRRRQKQKYLRRTVLENADKFKTYVSRNPLVLLADTFPKACKCLRRCKKARRKCIVCTKNGEVFRCPRCGHSYCQECYQDLVLPFLKEGKKCWFCEAKKELDEREQELADLMQEEDVIV